jgi:DNA-directed DNA polymerase III PolC
MTVESPSAGWVQLHTHSEHSPTDSLLKVKDLVAAAAADGNPALAITDHGTLGAIWKLGKYAKAAGLKAIPGIEAYLAIGDRHEHGTVEVEQDDADPDVDGVRGTKSKKYEHLTLLAYSRIGWENLVAMGNESQDSFWHKPRIDYELLAKYSEGLIVLTGCLGGPVAGPLSRGNRAEAIANLHTLIGCVGAGNVYVEVMDHGIEAQILIMDELRSVAAEVGLPLVATNDSHYLHADQQDAHEAWLAVGTGSVQTDEKRFRFHGTGHHLRTEAEMRALQDGADWWQAACDETVTIAARVADDVLPTAHLRLPVFPCPDGFPDSATYLKHLVRQGALARYGEDPARPGSGHLPPLVNGRLRFEFPVIFNAGIADYFLIVWDLIVWARSDRGYPTAQFPDGEPGKKKPIRVGPGRGSAAGSVVSYCLTIVGVDPLANNLLFERFLNPERAGMPDIDVDFEQGRRPEVLRYIECKHGRDKVARIGTFGVAATRRAILDASKFLGLAGLGAKLSPLVPIGAGTGKPVSLAALADTTNKAGDAFRAAVRDAGQGGCDVLALAASFEGVTKLEGIHACGTLISDEPMARLAPMRRDRAKGATDEDLLVTTWDGKDTEDYGFLKMDILGLRNLDIISAAVQFILEATGEVIDPDALVPGNREDAVRNAKTWELIGSGRTAGVFQLESGGITQLAENVAPNSLEDLTALVALYRPGPMAAGMHTLYAARKNGHEAVDYGYLTEDPAEQTAIGSVLDATYGVVCFQEHLMRLGEVVGGLTPAMRNKLQKAFSKKNVAMMAEVKDAIFAGGLAGAGSSGVVFSQATLDRLWVTFEGSAAYLFNACLTGDTVLENGKGIKWTVRDLYERLHGTDSSDGTCSRCHERPAMPVSGRCRRCDSWLTMFNDPSRGFSLLAHQHRDGRLRPARVRDVHYKGEALVFKVTLSDGTSVRATEDHRFMTADTTYVKVAQMVAGRTELLRDGGYQKQSSKQEDRTTSGPRLGRPGKPWLYGDANCGYVDGGFLALKEWTAQTRDAAACTACGRTERRLERAHLDGNRRNNTAGNLAWMCPGHHKAHDYQHNRRPVRWDKGHVTATAAVVAVELDGLEAVYDVEMADGTDHNFTANGIVSHNSHACAYGFVAYQTAYLKANWPVLYGAAILAMTDKDDKRLLAIRSLQVEGIEILAPDINRSGVTTAPDGDVVRLGLFEVKGVKSNAAHIVAEREANGPFTSLADAMARVQIPGKTKAGAPTIGTIAVNTMEALVEAGAFDEFGPRMGQSMILRAVRAAPGIVAVDAEWGVLERSARQRARLGLSTGPHPLVVLRQQIVDFSAGGQKPKSVHMVDRAQSGDRITLLGILAGWAEKAYKRGRMVTLTLEGSKGSVEGVMWDEDRAQLEATPTVGDLVVLSAQVRVRLVETERIDEEGETVAESFERRDLTVKRVARVPVHDGAQVNLPVAGDLVLPEPAAAVKAPLPRAKTPAPAAAQAVAVEAGAAAEQADWEAFGVWSDDVPVGEEPAEDFGEEPAAALATVRHLPVPGPEVITLSSFSLARTHPVLRAAVAAYDLPAGFNDPDGGVWVLTDGDGTAVLVVVGAHRPPAAAPLPTQKAGWTAASSPQTAAA